MATVKKTPEKKGKFPVDAEKIQRISRRFKGINHERLLRTREAIGERQRAFIDLLPLLFHTNHTLLPGYQSDDTINGIPLYTPDKNSIQVAKKIARGFKYNNKLKNSYDILAIYLMGSSGTIAYTKKSDFDVWICINADIDPGQRKELQRKADDIEEWATTLRLETHFFIMSDEEFRRGELSALSEDSSGTAQYHLLLDEFYRTGLLIAGNPPIWQMIPAEYEEQYEEYKQELIEKRLIELDEFVDFGDLGAFPVGEFFGAALWQLHKGIDSPHKAVLKIMLMETYANAYPKVDLLSLSYKKAVYEGEIDINRLDPYVLMEEKTEQYLKEQGDHDRVELARRCFYYKVDRQLSKTTLNKTWQHKAIKKIAGQWGWGASQFVILDQRSSWKIQQVIEERNSMISSLTQSYQLLSAFAREHADELTIGPEEINLLGRRLYSAFERKAGKIEIVNPSAEIDLSEERLSIHEIQHKSHDGWALYQGYVPSIADSIMSPLKRTRNLLEILAWCYFNRVLNPKATMVSLKPDDCTMDTHELQAIIDGLEHLFPKAKIPPIDMENLARPAHLYKNGIFINVGLDPMHSFTKKGVVLISDRTDSLNFGSRYENLALTFEQVLVTSWQEVLAVKYESYHALARCICDSFSRYPTTEDNIPCTPSCYSFSSKRGNDIAKRVTLLFKEIIKSYYQEDKKPQARYIYQAGKIYYILQPENNLLQYTHSGSFNALLEHLSKPQEVFSPIIIDRYILQDTPLPKIFALNQADHTQVFYQLIKDYAQVYILDEKGSLFHQKIPFHDHSSLLGQLYRFLSNINNRRSFLNQLDSNPPPITEPGFYQVSVNTKNKINVKVQKFNHKRLSKNFLDIQVISDAQDDGQTSFTLYCNKKEFSNIEHGDQLFNSVAQYVLGLRSGGQPYPIHITDIDISNTALAKESKTPLQTVHYLNYKKRIENMLNQALNKL
ncbi:MAG: class I adenylate cyclase [Gammaproteobacteria bacterium]|nr:class I adenylate cyclase [Gammaproteobacteria bacterium]